MNPVKTAMLIFTVINLVIIALAALFGFFKGWKKSLLGLCRTIVAALLAFLAAFLFCRYIPSGELYSVVESVIGKIALISESEALQEMAGKIVYTVAVPFVFSLLFIILDLLLLIPAYFVGRAFKMYGNQKSDKDKELPGKFIGAGIRIVTAMTVITLILMPLTNILFTLTGGVSKITDVAKTEQIEVKLPMKDISLLGYTLTDGEGTLKSDEADRMADDFIGPVQNNFFLAVSNSLPLRSMCNAMTGTSDPGGKSRNELAQIIDVGVNAVYLAVDLDNYGDKQKEAITNIIGYISESDLHSSVVAETVSYLAKDIIEKDGTPLGSGAIEIISSPLFEILANTTAETVSEDFNTLKNIIVTMIDYDIPAKIAASLESRDEAELINTFASEELLYDLLKELYDNDDYRRMTAPVIDYVFTLVVRIFDSETEPVHIADVSDSYSDEDVHTEARVLSKVFADAMKLMEIAPALMESTDPTAAIINSDIKFLGAFIDNARESALIGNGMPHLLVTLLKTSTFDSMRGVSDILIKHIQEDDKISMENLLGAVQQFVAITDLYKDKEQTDTSALASALRELNTSCDERTGAILKEIIDDSNILGAAILSSGVSEKDDSAAKVLGVMLDKLTAETYTDEEFEEEAKAIDLAMQLVQANTKEDIQNLCSDKEDRRELISTINESEIASAALLEVAYEDGDTSKSLTEDALKLKESLSEDDVNNMREECKEYYQEQIKAGTDNEQLEDNIKALSAIFDGNVSDEDLAAWADEAKN